MKVIKPPAPLASPAVGPSIFLGGSIEMGAAEDWQNKVIGSLQTEGGVLYSPRRDDWDPTWEQSTSNPQFVEQVNWELDALDTADVILMYFSPGTKSPISIGELYHYIDKKPIVPCCPPGFWRKGNIEILCERFDVNLFESLDAAVEEALSLAWEVSCERD